MIGLIKFYGPVLTIVAFALALGTGRVGDPNSILNFVLAMIALVVFVAIVIILLETLRRTWWDD